MDKPRCDWPGDDPLMLAYHDEEWGTACHDDILLFEHLSLDCFQAGLSWQIILNKRHNFKAAFDNFDFRRIAEYDAQKVEALVQDAGIVRNRAKIKATISNAQRALDLVDEFGSLDAYLWQFVDGQPYLGPPAHTWRDLPTTSNHSEAMSKDLKARGFKFVGPTICYATMQATGMVNDHQVGCFRYQPR
ncbi:MAG: DNA-3-methyladenine glycosylase I [Anaerolineales bacterium]